jgi:replicative DNA helicase
VPLDKSVRNDESQYTIPHSIEAERAVLGAMLISPQAVVRAHEVLRPFHFYKKQHRQIYEAMLELFKDNIEVDILALKQHPAANKLINEAGGVAHLVDISSSILSAANISHYLDVVREKWLLRRYLEETTDLMSEVYQETLSGEQLMEKAETLLVEIQEDDYKSKTSLISAELDQAAKELEIELFDKDAAFGLRSGFTDLDKMTTGFHPGDMIVVAARPSMGKTSFALNIAAYAALHHHKTVLIFSLEMSPIQLIKRMITSEARVNVRLQYSPTEQAEAHDRLLLAADRLRQAPIYIDDTPILSPVELRAKVRKLILQKVDVQLVVIDYIQLMESPGAENRNLELTQISGAIKSIAKEFRIPVLACSQLNREVDKRTDKRPILSDLRESGAIEQDADTVMFLFRQQPYLEKEMDAEYAKIEQLIEEEGDTPETKVKREFLEKKLHKLQKDIEVNRNVAEVIIGKQRHGPIGTVRLIFKGEHTRFENYLADNTDF